MPWADPNVRREKHKIYMRKHYKRNKKYYQEKIIDRKNKLKKWYRDYKQNIKCLKCNENDWRCIDFHHRDPENKFKSVSEMVAHGHSIKIILEEIEKCDPLCANCHRKLTIAIDGFALSP